MNELNVENLDFAKIREKLPRRARKTIAEKIGKPFWLVNNVLSEQGVRANLDVVIAALELIDLEEEKRSKIEKLASKHNLVAQ